MRLNYKSIIVTAVLSLFFLPTDSHGEFRAQELSDGAVNFGGGWKSHVDDYKVRGGSEEMPWHFHTGRGVVVQEIRSVEGGVVQRFQSRCKLNANDPDCMEKAYFFTEAEIIEFVSAAVSAYESDLQTHEMGVAVSSAIVVWSGKVFVASLVAPDPTVVASKLITIGSGLVAGAMAIVAAWEGMKIVEIHSTLRKIEELLAKERRYVTRCGHVSRNFLDRLRALGIRIKFLRNGFDLIPGHYYLEGVTKEAQLRKQTEQYAKENGLSYERAYTEFFSNACGQLPIIRSRRSNNSNPWLLLDE